MPRRLLGERLGSGNYGTVFADKNDPTVAIKRVKMTNTHQFRELEILRALKGHTHIVAVLEHTSRGNTLFMTFPRYDSCLSRAIRNPYFPISAALAKRYMEQLLDALAACHVKGIMHRDVKPENILLDAKTQTIVLADFGISKHIKEGRRRHSIPVVSQWYRAPELMLFPENDEYDMKVDVWSAGCIYAEMCKGVPIFARESEVVSVKGMVEFFQYKRMSIEERARSPSLWKTLYPSSPGIMQIMWEGCMNREPSRRLTSAQALRMLRRAKIDEIVIRQNGIDEMLRNQQARKKRQREMERQQDEEKRARVEDNDRANLVSVR